jgi:hypothetical protein
LQGFTWSFVLLTSHFVQIGLRTDKSVPFGKYCLSRPLVFSFDPRCHRQRPVPAGSEDVRSRGQTEVIETDANGPEADIGRAGWN